MIATPSTASTLILARASTPARRLVADGQPLPQVYLHPGQIHVSSEPSAITTVLGSCVAVCLYDARMKVGGMNHFLLPEGTADATTLGRYGESATHLLLDRMFALGASAETMTARIVGGANMLAALRTKPTLGERNAEVAAEILQASGVLISARDVGGISGRKLVFSPCDGIALVKVIGR